MRKQHASFANFICRFGDKALIDFANDIVLPAFFDDTLIRTYGKTHYHFYEPQLLRLEESDETIVAGICGRFVKDTILSRTQIFDDQKGLVKDEHSIRSSPSAFFILILNNHRLIYFPETAHAPDLKAFEATAKQFIYRKYSAFIDKSYEEQREGGKNVTKKALREQFPPPTLEIVPLTSVESIEQFVRRYAKLKKIELRLIKPNDDIDGKETFRELREYLDRMDPTSTKLTSSNPDGLNRASAIQVIHDASAAGNQEVKLSGVDADGNTLAGNNEHFKVTAEITPVPATTKGLASKLYAVFFGLLSQGVIRIDMPTPDRVGSISRFVRSLFEDN